ncbi:MAG: hypothetical protein A2X94_04710 [Bdellovibrionales bacterium GWB1_55_8]|nr:MAG: hypothetical protein A2X94_04710 [Bdellovibrionales bacterium GWB1_55_8]
MRNNDDAKLRSFLARHDMPPAPASRGEWNRILDAVENEESRSLFARALAFAKGRRMTFVAATAVAALLLAVVNQNLTSQPEAPTASSDDMTELYLADASQYFDESAEAPGDAYLELIDI